MVKKDDEVVEIDTPRGTSDSDEKLEEEIDEEDEGGIFDDDLVEEVVELGDDLVLGEEGSDFSIGDNILSSASAVESWEGQNLEDTLSDRWIEKDWRSEDEFVGGDVYEGDSESRGNVYGGGVSDAYGAGRDSGVYDEKSDVYSGKGGYEAQGGKDKSGDFYTKEIKSESDARTRGSRSGLEIAGFKDDVAEKRREARDFAGLV